jgi:hypothetical protein
MYRYLQKVRRRKYFFTTLVFVHIFRVIDEKNSIRIH